MKLPLGYSLRSLVARKTRTMLTVCGIAIAIFVSVLMIGLSRGLIACTVGNAAPDNVTVLSKGAESMEFSAIDRSAFHLLKGTPGIRADRGEELASPEAYLSAFVEIPGGEVAGERRGVVRGLLPVGMKVHEQVRIVAGTGPQRGFGVAVGKLAATKLGVTEKALSIGRKIHLENQEWNVVGIFEAPGTTLESEIWGHLDDVLVASKRTDYSVITLKTIGGPSVDELLFNLEMRTDIRVDAKTEQAYYAVAANALKPVQAVSAVMTVMLVVCGVLAAMNTMFTSILGRTREMGVLLVLGYKRKAVLISFVLESVLLGLTGGVLGCSVGALLNELPMRIPMGAFRFAVDASTLAVGVGLSILIGVAGGVVPVMRVVALKTVEALRAE